MEFKKILTGLLLELDKHKDIVGMKLEGIRNNPKREMKDWADIQSIVEFLGDDLDWEKIRNYCKITSMEDAYDKSLGFR